MRRYELTDEQWEQISDLFPTKQSSRGGQWKDHRTVMNGMFDRIVERLHLQLDKDGYIDWQLWAVDSTVIRAHKSAAGAGKKGEQKSRENLQTMP